jgi:hypothetical protein
MVKGETTFQTFPTAPTFQVIPSFTAPAEYLVQCPKCNIFHMLSMSAAHVCASPAFTWTFPPPAPTREEFDALVRRVQELEARQAARKD